MKLTYFELDGMLVLLLSDKPIVREVSSGWFTPVSYAEDGNLLEAWCSGGACMRCIACADVAHASYLCVYRVLKMSRLHIELTAVLTPADEGGFVALNPRTGTTTQGESVEQALDNLREATALYLEEFPLVA